VRLEGLSHLKKSNELIWNRTRDLLVYSIVSQSTTLPRAVMNCTKARFVIKAEAAFYKARK
jgi:hypothetical protein